MNVNKFEGDLIKLEKKFDLIRDRVRGVALKNDTGFFLFGRGGIGKSHTVTSELEATRTRWKLLNSHVTAIGLFDFLRAHHDHVIVLDDMEQLFEDKIAIGILRSATWSGGIVTKTIQGQTVKFRFQGGVIILSNLPLRDLPHLDALATRLSPAEFNVEEDEIIALMWKISCEGKFGLEPSVCKEVFEFIVKNCSKKASGRLDLRIFEHGLKARKMYELKQVKTSWEDLFMSRFHGKIFSPVMEVRKNTPQPLDLDSITKELYKRHPANATKRVGEWRAITGLPERDLLRRAHVLGLTPCTVIPIPKEHEKTG